MSVRIIETYSFVELALATLSVFLWLWTLVGRKRNGRPSSQVLLGAFCLCMAFRGWVQLAMATAQFPVASEHSEIFSALAPAIRTLGAFGWLFLCGYLLTLTSNVPKAPNETHTG